MNFPFPLVLDIMPRICMLVLYVVLCIIQMSGHGICSSMYRYMLWLCIRLTSLHYGSSTYTNPYNGPPIGQHTVLVCACACTIMVRLIAVCLVK